MNLKILKLGLMKMCFLHLQKSCSSWCFRSPAGQPRAHGGLLFPARRWERCWSAQSYSLSGPLETCCSPPVETHRVILHFIVLLYLIFHCPQLRSKHLFYIKPCKCRKPHKRAQLLELFSVKVSYQNWLKYFSSKCSEPHCTLILKLSFAGLLQALWR